MKPLQNTVFHFALYVVTLTTSFLICTQAQALPERHFETAPFVAVDDPREIVDDVTEEELDPSYQGLSEKDLLEIMISEEIAALETENALSPEHERDPESLEHLDLQKLADAQSPEAIAQITQADSQLSASDDDLERIFEEEYGIGKDLTPYRLRIGDRLYISIYGEPNTGRITLVDHTGHITYLLVGEIFVLGKTIEELRYELNQTVKKFFQHAVVAITPVEFGSQYYTILGQVKLPGKKIITGRPTVLSALAEAGGFTYGSYRTQTIELADLTHAFLARDGDYIPVDFSRLVNNGDMREDVELLSGDYIYIPLSLYREIAVCGEVKAPTTFGFIERVSLVEAIAQARGLTDRASSRIVVIRGSLSYPKKYLVDINLILRGLEPDFLLKPGDIVYAPPRRFQHLRDLVYDAIRIFIGDFFNAAGGNTFVQITPEAAGFQVQTTSPIGGNTTVNQVFIGPGVSSGFP